MVNMAHALAYPSDRTQEGHPKMQDLIWLAVASGLVLLALAYTAWLDRV